jgi:hypothetical protein
LRMIESPCAKHDLAPLSPMIIKAVVIWFLLILAEILHGVLRAVLLVPHVGEFRSSQIGVFTGSAIILVIATLTVRWIGTARPAQLLGIGVIWLVLMVTFEILFGRFVVGASWERLASDYNVPQGGLMPFGLLILALSPLIAARIRGIVVMAEE